MLRRYNNSRVVCYNLKWTPQWRKLSKLKWGHSSEHSRNTRPTKMRWLPLISMRSRRTRRSRSSISSPSQPSSRLRRKWWSTSKHSMFMWYWWFNLDWEQGEDRSWWGSQGWLPDCSEPAEGGEVALPCCLLIYITSFHHK